MARYQCEKCGRVLDEKQFYKHRDGTYWSLCKKCATMFVDNFKPDTFLWLLEEADVPYVEGEWNILRDRAFAKDPTKINGMSVFGKYIAKMKLNQWGKYHWADSETLREELQKKKAVEEEQQRVFVSDIQEKYKEGIISEAQYKTFMSSEEQQQQISLPVLPDDAIAKDGFYNEEDYLKPAEMPDPGAELTTDDKMYLAMKWGRLYKPSEWVELEKQYKEMSDAFDIQDPDSRTTLTLICKTTLKANQALDCGDVEGFQKLSKVLEGLRKSAKFTAAQNKEEEKVETFNSIGELVSFCELNKGKIPRYKIEVPLDRVDKIIDDLKRYNKELVYSDPTLAAQIEDYLKRKIAIEESNQNQEDEETPVKENTSEDYMEFFDSIARQREADAAEVQDESE